MTKFKAMYLAQLKKKEELERSLGGYGFYGNELYACGCGCYYEGKGGSTSETNGKANMNGGGLCSPVQ